MTDNTIEINVDLQNLSSIVDTVSKLKDSGKCVIVNVNSKSKAQEQPKLTMPAKPECTDVQFTQISSLVTVDVENLKRELRQEFPTLFPGSYIRHGMYDYYARLFTDFVIKKIQQ